jgi:hypothetical protein
MCSAKREFGKTERYCMLWIFLTVKQVYQRPHQMPRVHRTDLGSKSKQGVPFVLGISRSAYWILPGNYIVVASPPQTASQVEREKINQ